MQYHHRLECNLYTASPRQQRLGYGSMLARLVAVAIVARTVVPCSGALRLRASEADDTSLQTPDAPSSPALAEDEEDNSASDIGDATPPVVPMMPTMHPPLPPQLSFRRSAPLLSTAHYTALPSSKAGSSSIPAARMSPPVAQTSFFSSGSVLTQAETETVKSSGIDWDVPPPKAAAPPLAPPELPQWPLAASLELPAPVVHISRSGQLAASGGTAAAVVPEKNLMATHEGSDDDRPLSSASALMAFRQRLVKRARLREERDKLARRQRLIIHKNKFVDFSKTIHMSAVIGSILCGFLFVACLMRYEIVVR